MKELQDALKGMQEKVIGVFHPDYYPANRWIPVISYDNGNLTCIEVGSLFGLTELHIGMHQGTFKRFFKMHDRLLSTPLTLAQMMENPFEFNEWWNQNIKS